MERKKGSIITLNNGFGQIQIENQLNSIFFHVSEVDGPFSSYKIGQIVEFDLEEGPRGLMAKRVHHVE
ncbi:cold shock domain-containing protein [Candidatus Peregrinibacteria bacterium]|nr:cold shock domain-containing protein [Candidatus Peregrinibacteria bacterium]